MNEEETAAAYQRAMSDIRLALQVGELTMAMELANLPLSAWAEKSPKVVGEAVSESFGPWTDKQRAMLRAVIQEHHARLKEFGHPNDFQEDDAGPMGFAEQEAHALMRVQVAMWLPASCWCGKPYQNVDDFLARTVRRGYGEGMEFVDDECWDAYCEARTRAIQEESAGD